MRENESIRALKGVGEKTEKLFQKVGVSTVGQLLRYYPRDYDIYREPVSVDSLNDQETGNSSNASRFLASRYCSWFDGK